MWKRQGIRKSSKKSPSHDYSVKQEYNLAKKLGGSMTPKSGAGEVKGDVRIKGKYRIECKCTAKGSYSIKKEYLEGLIEAASACGETFILNIDFLDASGNKKRGFYVIPDTEVDL